MAKLTISRYCVIWVKRLSHQCRPAKRRSDQSIQTTLEYWKSIPHIKLNLRIRPIYHHLQRRTESHICISFMVCKMYKKLERQLGVKKWDSLSAAKVIDIFKNHLTANHYNGLLKYKNTRLMVKMKSSNLLQTWVTWKADLAYPLRKTGRF